MGFLRAPAQQTGEFRRLDGFNEQGNDAVGRDTTRHQAREPDDSDRVAHSPERLELPAGQEQPEAKERACEQASGETPAGARVELEAVAAIRDDRGPNFISRENGQRKIVVSANVAGRDLRSVVDGIREAVAASVTLPPGYALEYGGQFESEAAASRRLLWLGISVVLGVLVLLTAAFRSFGDAVIIMLNLPLALIGAIVAEFFGSPTLGLGFRISTSIGQLDLAMVWSAIVVAALSGTLFYGIIAFFERRATFWHPSQRG